MSRSNYSEFARQKKRDSENLYYEKPDKAIRNSSYYDKLKEADDMLTDATLSILIELAKQGKIKNKNDISQYFINLTGKIPYNLWWYNKKLVEMKLID